MTQSKTTNTFYGKYQRLIRGKEVHSQTKHTLEKEEEKKKRKDRKRERTPVKKIYNRIERDMQPHQGGRHYIIQTTKTQIIDDSKKLEIQVRAKWIIKKYKSFCRLIHLKIFTFFSLGTNKNNLYIYYIYIYNIYIYIYMCVCVCVCVCVCAVIMFFSVGVF